MVSLFASVVAIDAISISTVTSIITVVTLIMCLLTRELTAIGNSQFQTNIFRYTSISVLPLVLAFTAIVIITIIDIL